MTRLLSALLCSLFLAVVVTPLEAAAQGAASGAEASGTASARASSTPQGTGENPIGGRPAGVQLTPPQVAGAQAARTAQAATQGAGDQTAGGKKAAQCLGCHNIPGYQASFPEVHKVPMIAGQSAKYIVAALGAYKNGERKHPTMRSIGAVLSEQDMADLGAFYEQLGKADGGSAPPAAPPAPPADVQALLGKMNCASCHGANFSSPIDASYPKLAGQHPDYLYVALKAYQTDRAAVGRANAIMKGMAAPYSHAELKKIAQYLGGLPGELKVVPQPRFKR